MIARSITELSGSDIPTRLDGLVDKPERIYVQGSLPSVIFEPNWHQLPFEGQKRPVVAIVGARRASQFGRNIAHGLAARTAEAGAIIISGGALGIDTAAHEGALSVGGSTLSVLPSSIYRPLPRANSSLFEAILESQGAWLSEYATEQSGKWPFCRRNRLIAALCDILIVVEAGFRSGTAHTVRYAKKLGRRMGALPWQVGDVRGQGCLRVFQAGGQVVTNAQDIYGLLGRSLPPRPKAQDFIIGGKVTRSEIELRILDVLEAQVSVTTECFCQRLQLPIQEVSAALGRLELDGHIQQGPSGYYSRSGSH